MIGIERRIKIDYKHKRSSELRRIGGQILICFSDKSEPMKIGQIQDQVAKQIEEHQIPFDREVVVYERGISGMVRNQISAYIDDGTLNWNHDRSFSPGINFEQTLEEISEVI